MLRTVTRMTDCRLLGPVGADALAKWITAIPFEEWPQQHRLPGGQIRPSMQTDITWHGFGEIAEPVVNAIMQEHFPGGIAYQRMLSVVMPGHSIPPHCDEQAKSWICRVHVPLMSNAKSRFIVGGQDHVLAPGFAYRVNTRAEHAVTNDGETPRIHFMFDVGK